MGGTPVIRGTRIPAQIVAALFDAGIPMERILQSYPSLTESQLELVSMDAKAGQPIKDRQDLPYKLDTQAICGSEISTPQPQSIPIRRSTSSRCSNLAFPCCTPAFSLLISQTKTISVVGASGLSYFRSCRDRLFLIAHNALFLLHLRAGLFVHIHCIRHRGHAVCH